MPKPCSHSPFPEPKENYTKTPNVLFDRYLCALTSAAVLILLVIIRKSWGWQRACACISLSLFMRLTGIRSKNTIRKAIEELLTFKDGLIFRYETGRGSNTKTFYWINTEKNYRIYEAVVTGRISLEEAQSLSSANVDKPKVIHNDEETDGAENDISNGSIFEPSSEESDGSNSDTIKERATRQKRRKKGKKEYPPIIPELRREDPDAAERYREQILTRKRLSGESPQTKNI